MKHTNDLEEGQNVNTLSEIEEYYKAREQQLLEKLHQQEAALAAAEQTPFTPASGSRTCSSAMAETNFCWCYPAFRETSCKPNWNRSKLP